MLLGLAAFFLSLVSNHTKETLHTKGVLHPWLHFALFTLLGLLAMAASSQARIRVWLLAAAALLGLSIEYTEAVRFVARFETFDVVTDTCGVLFGALVGYLLFRRKR